MPLQKIKDTLELIKFSHSIFALPFALGAMLIAARGFPEPILFFRILLAVIFARTAAMAFNRWIDADIDAENPRTQNRHLPQGLMSKRFVITLWLLSSLGFMGVAFLLGKLCFILSFFALFILFFYSYTKRFTHYSQFFLGLSLSLAPAGAWIAVTGSFGGIPFILSLAVLFWVAGFDILYATQDEEFDRQHKLHSMVVKLGIRKALICARSLHLLSFLLMLMVGGMAHLHQIYFIGLVLMGVLFFYQHRLVKPQDLSRVNAAFFTTNGVISLLFLLSVYFSL